MSKVVVPVVSWSQRNDFINLNVEIPDAKNVRVSFSDDGHVQVSATGSDEKENELNLELFNQIRSSLCKYKVTGRKVELKIEKLSDDVEYWPRLTKSKEKNRNITIDWSRWVDEDDQDEEEAEEENTDDWNYQNQGLPPQGYAGEDEDDDDEEDDENNIHDGNYKWYEGMDEYETYKRFIDSYRLRVEDEYSHSGQLRGLYAQEDPLSDFKTYLQSAHDRNLLPQWWDEQHEKDLLHTAQHDEWSNINFAVEKHDIEEKYNQIAPLELRALAELILD